MNKYTVKVNDNLFNVTDYQNYFTLEMSYTISFKKCIMYSNLNILNENATSNGYSSRCYKHFLIPWREKYKK